jgi:hypothetical protein
LHDVIRIKFRPGLARTDEPRFDRATHGAGDRDQVGLGRHVPGRPGGVCHTSVLPGLPAEKPAS